MSSPSSGFKEVSLDAAQQFGTDSGRFRYQRSLGCGTFGSTLLAVDNSSSRSVAVKLLCPGGTYDRGWMTMLRMQGLLHEAKALNELSHDCIVSYEYAFHYEVEGDLFVAVVTGCCAEGSLNEYLISHRYLDDDQRNNLARQMASGLEFLHASGVQHRNLKPDNILIDSSANARLAEFGLAKLSWDVKDLLTTRRLEPLQSYILRTSRLSAAFMAPETHDGVWAEGSDVFSLGLVMAVMANTQRFIQQVGGRSVVLPFVTRSSGGASLGSFFHNTPSSSDQPSLLLGFSSSTVDSRNVSGTFLRLMDKMLSKDQGLRVGVSEIRFSLEQMDYRNVPAALDLNEPLQMENSWSCCCFQ